MSKDKIPYVVIGNDEIDDKAKSRIDELWGSKNENDGIKLLSLLLSRGKTEEGKQLHCSNNCEHLYLVFSYDKLSKCECGGTIKYV